jgi:hypothetical protein
MKIMRRDFNITSDEKMLATELLDILAEIISSDILKKTEEEKGGCECQKM